MKSFLDDVGSFASTLRIGDLELKLFLMKLHTFNRFLLHLPSRNINSEYILHSLGAGHGRDHTRTRMGGGRGTPAACPFLMID